MSSICVHVAKTSHAGGAGTRETSPRPKRWDSLTMVGGQFFEFIEHDDVFLFAPCLRELRLDTQPLRLVKVRGGNLKHLLIMLESRINVQRSRRSDVQV